MPKIDYMTITLHLAGERFDPLRLDRRGLKFTILRGPGLPAQSGGKRKKVPRPGGHAYFEIGAETPYAARVATAVQLYHEIKSDNARQSLGIDSFHLSILFTGLQGNMELDAGELSALATVDGGIAMTYIGASDIDYRKQKRLHRLKRGLDLAIVPNTGNQRVQTTGP